MRAIGCVLVVAAALAPGAMARKDAVLFDGKTLAGWQGDARLWRVQGGEIVGTVTERLARNEFLISDKVLRDFRLVVDVKLTTQGNNSGIQFRSRKIDNKGHASVAGYQADIGGKEGVYWGQLYHEHGRGWLSKKSCGAYAKTGDWNSYEILAVGSRIQTALNGRPCVDLDDPQGEREGVIALQLHSGGAIEVRFRNFRVEHDPKAHLKTLAQRYDAKRVEGASGKPAAVAAGLMTAPPGFRVSLVAAEPDVRQPVAVTFDHRGRLWVAEALSYPKRRPAAEAADKILIFEDRDADGKFESRKVFADRLNLVSGLELGFGGVWVGAAPHLLFIPDRDGDDVPDGEPQVLLDGWGDQDTHETLNSFIWGPDGWLYGNHGVFTHSAVGKPGTPDKDRKKLDAAVWRYHPTRRVFEVYAHGGSNQWGLDFDDDGQAFMTTCRSASGGGPVTHVIQGGYYWRQAGSHKYEHVYEPMMASADHDHGTGGAGEPGSDEKYGGHSHVGTMIYLGNQWPAQYRNTLFTHNLHGNRINHEVNERRGSGYVTRHAAADFLFANDPWFVGVDLLYGPDGAMFMIDWYDRQHCHHHDVEKWDRTSGRIYRVDYGESRGVKVDLARLSDRDLVNLQLHSNDWYVRVARRLLQERAAERPIAKPAEAALARLLHHPEPRRQLRAVWALHATGGLDETLARSLLASTTELVRAWAVHLVAEKSSPASATAARSLGLSRPTLARLTEMARSDASPFVRRALASALQRLPVSSPSRWLIAEALAGRAEDAEDRNVPHLVWFGVEPLVTGDLPRALRLARMTKLPLVARSVFRRASMEPRGLDAVVATLADAPGADRRVVLEAMATALERRRVPMPAGWSAAAAASLASDTPEERRIAERLGAQFGDERLFSEMRRRLGDPSAAIQARRHAFDVLVIGMDDEAAPVFQRLLDEPAFRTDAMRALARWNGRDVGEKLLASYSRWTAAERAEAVNVLVTRPSWALALLAAVEAKTVPSGDVSAFAARQMAALEDPEVRRRLTEIWGTTRGSSQDAKGLVARYKTVVSTEGGMPSSSQGRAAFNKICAPCHKLFGEGGEIGPDLTGSKRTDLDYLLENILDPSAVIGRDYQLSTVKTRDGRLVAGMIHAASDKAVTLRTLAESVTVSRKDIDSLETSDVSMMPEGLLGALSDQEVRDLFRYLAATSQAPLPP